MALLSDNNIVNALNIGDNESFSYLFSKFYQSVCVYLLKYGLDSCEAEEIAQDSFLKLWERREDFNHLNSILSFLYVTSKNAALNTIDKKKRLLLKQEDYLNQDTDYIELPITHQIIYTETLSALRLAIQELPDQCKRILNLMYEEGLSPQEISQRLDITTSTVYNQKARGVVLLREKLNCDNFYLIIMLLSLLKK